MKNILLLSGILGLLSFNVLAQNSTPQSTSALEVNAKVDPGCFLTAENINFGVLSMPLSDSISQSNMKIQCSKGTNLIFQISYTNSGIVSSSGSYTSQSVYTIYNSSSQHSHRIYLNGTPISSSTTNFNNFEFDIICGTKGVAFYSSEAKQLYGVPLSTVDNQWNNDIWSVCSGIQINTTTLSAMKGTEIGTLNGLFKGEEIKYYLTIPGESTIWNSSNKYQITSIGTEQLIPLKANIKRSDNATHRFSPDTYQSNLTVVLTY